MRLHALAHPIALRTIAIVGAVAALALAVGARPSAARSPAAAAATPQGGMVIQVRDIPAAPTVEIVAWNSAEPAYGLRTWVRRNGTPDRYHRFWVSVDFDPAGRDVASAQALDRPAQTSIATDTQNCLNGKCSPGTTFGARILDGLLRSSKDNVPVKFLRTSGGDFTITMRRGLIDAYLASVDSVITALKK